MVIPFPKINVNKIKKFPIPINVKQVQSFVDMVNYFRPLIYNLSDILRPIINLTKKNTKFVWTQDYQEAFDSIQNILVESPTVKNIVPNKDLCLVTDASLYAICGILIRGRN